ncbi:ligand-binding sensor domain-containing protein/DNA-binding CsgD family transcriptional regulator [Pedobacter sp. UYP30]|uniref:ligand-binding sensor domain-containing protein n=1 Tax=Pedobacter sp. UYP30 TaxID=1756400 RepID=UPI003391AD4A
MSLRIRPLVFAIFLCLFKSYAFAYDIKSIGVPYIENFPKALYGSGNQNWSVTKDLKGVMYFGNAEGLLTYDGTYWQKYLMPNRQIVRAVAADKDGRVYVGSFGEFGYWKLKNNRFSYHSLTKLLPKGVELKDEIWKIYIDKDRVLFQSFSEIIIYKNKKLSVVKAPSSFLFLHHANNKFFVEVLNKGLFELVGNKLVFLPGSEKLGSDGVLCILPFKKDTYLIGTSKSGLFLYDEKQFVPFTSAANNFLKTFQLNNGTVLKDKYFAFGTILNGLIIIDSTGNIVQKINKSSGLQNNTVLSIFADDEQNLWAGLDNGIDRIELNSPLYYYFDKSGQFGTVYSSIIFHNNIYLGTNQGLFYSKWSPENTSSNFNFSLIPGSQGQVWDLEIVDDELICGHNDGTFRVFGGFIEKISSISGGWILQRLKSNPNFFIQGTYNGLALFEKNPGNSLKFVTKISGFEEPSRYVEQDSKGDIWVSQAYKGLYKLTLSKDFTTVTKIDYFDKKNGLPGDFNVNIFNLENKIVFSSNEGFYTYDEFSDKFSKYKVLNQSLGLFASSNKIIDAGSRKYWFINHGKTAMVDFSKRGKIVVDSSKFSQLDGRMVQFYENISKIGQQRYLISVDDGFVIYNADDNSNAKQAALPKVLIRRIDDITDKYINLSEGADSSAIASFKNSRNNIRISFSLPYYRQAKIKFQYFLEGYSKDWSEWNSATQKDFTNLQSGNYVFKVRAKTNGGSTTNITSYRFTISNPWYFNIWAIVVYLAMFVILLILGKKIYEQKLKKDSEQIALKLKAEQEEIIKEEAEANERNIHKIQTDRLQAELSSKSRELANSAMSLVYKNELLQKLSEEIIKLKDGYGKQLPEDQTRKIQKVINDGMNDERDWHLFEHSFNEAHESFFIKLKKEHPALVPNDLKLCAYLRMNMSSKEMSSLLNISLRGVEIRRYRLRKKLDVPHDKNLSEFLMEI